MALEESFADLVAKWRQLNEALQALRVTVVEDQPLSGGVLLVERCGYTAEDLVGWAKEGLGAASEAQDAVGANHNLNQARRALATSQQRFGRLSDECLEFNSFDCISELMRFGRKQRGEWLAWVRTVQESGAQCWQPIKEVREALVCCWQELAEHLVATSVSVQTTNIGQQITGASKREVKERTEDALT